MTKQGFQPDIPPSKEDYVPKLWNGKWWFRVDGKPFGGYDTRKEARVDWREVVEFHERKMKKE